MITGEQHKMQERYITPEEKQRKYKEKQRYRNRIDSALIINYGGLYALWQLMKSHPLHSGGIIKPQLAETRIAQYYEAGLSPEQAAADIYELVQTRGEYI